MAEQEIDALYGLPLEEFTKARNELATDLRSRGEHEAAKEVRGLAKPSAAAWAVNQVMRTQRKDARALLEAGERLRKAHEDAAAGSGSAGELRKAADAERAIVERLAQAARGLTNANGRDLSESVIDRVRETLHAVAADDATRALAAGGRLSKERKLSGLGGFSVPAAKARPRDKRAARSSAAQVQRARERLDRAQQEARELRSARTNAARATSSAEKALARAREDLRLADRRVGDKEDEVEKLRKKLGELR